MLKEKEKGRIGWRERQNEGRKQKVEGKKLRSEATEPAPLLTMSQKPGPSLPDGTLKSECY